MKLGTRTWAGGRISVSIVVVRDSNKQSVEGITNTQSRLTNRIPIWCNHLCSLPYRPAYLSILGQCLNAVFVVVLVRLQRLIPVLICIPVRTVTLQCMNCANSLGHIDLKGMSFTSTTKKMVQDRHVDRAYVCILMATLLLWSWDSARKGLGFSRWKWFRRRTVIKGDQTLPVMET